MARELVTSDSSVYFSAQTALGAIDANPVFTKWRRSSGAPVKTPTYTTSAELVDGRNGAQQVYERTEYTASPEGPITQQTIGFLAAAIHSAAKSTRTETDTGIAATASGFTGVGIAVAAGDIMFVSGFANALINTTYFVVSNTAGTLVTSPVPAATESAGASVTLTSNVYANGSTQTAYTVQERMYDESAAGNTNYQTQYDHFINEMTATIPDSGECTFSATTVGNYAVSGTAAISGQTDAAEDTSEVASAVHNVVRYWLDDAPVEDCGVKTFEISVSNGYENSLGSACTANHWNMGSKPEFTCSFSGRTSTADSRKWQKLAENPDNAQTFGVEFHWADGKSFVLLFDNAKITQATASGDNVVSIDGQAIGQKSASTGKTVRIFTNF